MPATAPAEVRIGRVVSVQVPKREVRIAPETDVPDRFASLTVARFRDREGAVHAWPVRAYRPAGANVVLTLEGPTDAEVAALRKATVIVPPEERGELPEDMFFVDDVIGAEVVDAAGARIGAVTHVGGTAAQTVLEVRADANGRTYSIACVPAHVLELDEAAGRVVVDPTYLLDEDGHAY